jgi:hypothetical protein
MLNLFSRSSVRKARRPSRNLNATVAGLEGRALLSMAAVPPVQLVGDVLVIAAAPAGNSVAAVFFSDAEQVEVDYAPTGGLGGHFTSYYFDPSRVSAVVFLGNGGDQFENDTNLIPSLVLATGSGNSFIGGLEDDAIVFIGDDNQAGGGGGSDLFFSIGASNSFTA